MKKKVKLGLALAVVCLALVGLAACQGGSGEEVSQQMVKVERGNLSISVTGSGSIESTREARLTFGSSGKVETILVQEGGEVKEGDVLAELDTSTLELALSQSRLGLTQAEVALSQAKIAKQTAEYTLKKTRDSENALEAALLNAQVSKDQAQKLLDSAVVSADYQLAKSQLDKAEAWYRYVIEDWPKDTASVDDYHLALQRAEDQLKAAQTQYDSVLSGYDTGDVAIKKKQVEAAEKAVTQAQRNLDDLSQDIAIQELQVESATQTVSQAEQSLELAQKSFDDAQRQLDEATIVAPFDGVIASVPVKEGDSIPAPTMAPTTIIYMLDPHDMELVVEVDEIDIPLLKLDQGAVVTVDALPGKEFQGKVTAIYPVPKEVGGVVLYNVRMSLDVPQDSGIKTGMSASADVMISESDNVLVVPSRAIETDGQGNTTVKVISGDQTEERPVVVGLDDGLRAEIVSGLQEGETVVFEVRLKTASTSMF